MLRHARGLRNVSDGRGSRARVRAGPWTYGDRDGSDNGYAADQAAQVTVETPMVDWCNLQLQRLAAE